MPATVAPTAASARESVRAMLNLARAADPELSLVEALTGVRDSIRRNAESTSNPAMVELCRLMWREAGVALAVATQPAAPTCLSCSDAGTITVTPEATDGRPLGPRDIPCPDCRPAVEGPAARIMRLAREVGAA